MFRRFLLLTACSFFPGAAVAVESEAGAVCMFERLSSEDRVLLGEYALGGENLPSGLDARLTEHAEACGERLSLGDEQLEEAGVSLLARLVLERTRVRLDVAGIPVEALDAWFDMQTVSVRANYGGARMSEAEVQALTISMVAALEARGVAPGRVRQHADLIGSYLSTRALHFRMQHDLPHL